MSGIVGSKLNIRGSGRVAKLGTDGQVLTSAGAGVSAVYEDASGGGTSWQSVETGATFTAVAGNGYPVNTTAQACTVTLPAGSVGDTIEFVDYAGTWDTYAVTLTADGSENIIGSTDDIVFSSSQFKIRNERQGVKIVYVDATQGWEVITGVHETSQFLPTGGTITTSGDYRIHTFTSSGEFILWGTKTIEYLIVGGGGSGGWDVGGGGGAGGMLASSASKTANTYTIVIGAGASAPSGQTVQNNGEDTTALGLTANGGGGGGNWNNSADATKNGADGGSGGGGGGWSQTTTGGSGTAGQGNDGGDAPTNSSGYTGGGGGGAGGAGADEGTGASVAAGIGSASSITGSEVTYAVGGTGGNDGSYSRADGEVNKGGGGDAAGAGAPNHGGSGVVILRYTT